MVRAKYCCEASRDLYRQYYNEQAGHGSNIPVFRGYSGQRGHGLGSLLSGLFRSAMPMLKRGLGFLGKQIFNTGANIASDVMEGQSLRESAKKRAAETINTYIPGAIDQSGSGKRRRIIKRRKIKKVRRDIFD